MVGHLLQHHPVMQALHLLLARGELGKIQYITSNRLNLGKIRREENALWSFAPHDISVILSLVGSQLPETVRCMGGEYLNHGIADTTLTFLHFAGDIRAHVYVSWLNPFKEQKLTVVGSNGIAVFDDTRPWNEKLLLYRQYLTWTNGQIPTPSKAKAEPVVVPEAEPLRAECQHFLTCCHERRAPLTDGAEGLRVLQVLQAAQQSLERDGEAVIAIDLMPDKSVPTLAQRLSTSRGKQSLANFLRKTTRLSPAAVSLLREAERSLAALNAEQLAALIKAVRVRLVGVQDIANAISTAGGVSFAALDARFMLRRLPGVFAAGEMLDWEAPTGGYLLQASCSTGVAAGHGALAWLRERPA